MSGAVHAACIFHQDLFRRQTKLDAGSLVLFCVLFFSLSRGAIVRTNYSYFNVTGKFRKRKQDHHAMEILSSGCSKTPDSLIKFPFRKI